MRVLKVPFYACLTTLTQFMMTEAGLVNLDSTFDEGVGITLLFGGFFYRTRAVLGTSTPVTIARDC